MSSKTLTKYCCSHEKMKISLEKKRYFLSNYRCRYRIHPFLPKGTYTYIFASMLLLTPSQMITNLRVGSFLHFMSQDRVKITSFPLLLILIIFLSVYVPFYHFSLPIKLSVFSSLCPCGKLFTERQSVTTIG